MSNTEPMLEDVDAGRGGPCNPRERSTIQVPDTIVHDLLVARHEMRSAYSNVREQAAHNLRVLLAKLDDVARSQGLVVDL